MADDQQRNVSQICEMLLHEGVEVYRKEGSKFDRQAEAEDEVEVSSRELFNQVSSVDYSHWRAPFKLAQRKMRKFLFAKHGRTTRRAEMLARERDRLKILHIWRGC